MWVKLQKHMLLWGVILFWWIIATIFYSYLQVSWLTMEAFIFQVYQYLRENIIAWAFLFIVLYTIRPFVFIPAVPMTVFAWAVFWFIGGLVICTLANISSSTLSYWIWCGTWWKFIDSAQTNSYVKKLQGHTHQHPFSTVVMMRLLFAPFDIANCACWVLKIPFGAFTSAIVACIPGTAVFVLAWAAFYGKEITTLSQVYQNINYSYLYSATGLLLLIIIISKVLQKRQKPEKV